ncbi:response regulator [Bowmanella dokdonensis]|uniref:Response regulator n=1 Tax=Bowmanella dokdonensis TaxID=751969 RepID=A0A939DRX1_9ALTE|nr:response regulator [Bowmanella dokdonensis]MBN7827675.1 response regulator [Bowmanella dokdonensis]
MTGTEFQVLAVDDAQLMCHFIYETITGLQGFACKTATEFVTAEAALKNHKIDMAIIDIQLKNASGLTLAKNIRMGRYSCRHDIPILIFTGFTYKDDIKQCLAFDMHDVLVKPVTVMELRERVKKNKNKRMEIKPPEYYQSLEEPAETARKEMKAAITKSVSAEKSRYQPKPVSVESRVESSDEGAFIKWPDQITSGYHQLDRRMKTITFLLNTLHWSTYRKDKYTEAGNDINKIKLASDDMHFVAQRLKTKHPGDPMWTSLFDRLKGFSTIPIEKLSVPDLPKEQAEDIFKRLHNAWLSILSKPVIKRI